METFRREDTGRSLAQVVKQTSGVAEKLDRLLASVEGQKDDVLSGMTTALTNLNLAVTDAPQAARDASTQQVAFTSGSVATLISDLGLVTGRLEETVDLIRSDPSLLLRAAATCRSGRSGERASSPRSMALLRLLVLLAACSLARRTPSRQLLRAGTRAAGARRACRSWCRSTRSPPIRPTPAAAWRSGTSAYRIEYSTYHRWASPPRSLVESTLRDWFAVASAGTSRPAVEVDGMVQRLEAVEMDGGGVGRCSSSYVRDAAARWSSKGRMRRTSRRRGRRRGRGGGVQSGARPGACTVRGRPHSGGGRGLTRRAIGSSTRRHPGRSPRRAAFSSSLVPLLRTRYSSTGWSTPLKRRRPAGRPVEVVLEGVVHRARGEDGSRQRDVGQAARQVDRRTVDVAAARHRFARRDADAELREPLALGSSGGEQREGSLHERPRLQETSIAASPIVFTSRTGGAMLDEHECMQPLRDRARARRRAPARRAA